MAAIDHARPQAGVLLVFDALTELVEGEADLVVECAGVVAGQRRMPTALPKARALRRRPAWQIEGTTRSFCPAPLAQDIRGDVT